MTWLPVAVGQSPDHEAVFGLLPEQWDNLCELHASAWAMTDQELLELCWRRMAQTLGCRWPLGVDIDRLQALHEWWSSNAFTETERAALNYVDHFVLDSNAVTPEMNAEVERRLGSRRALYQFVAAANTVEALLRTCILLDLDPLLPRRDRSAVADSRTEGQVPAPLDGVGLREYYRAVVDARFWKARAVYGASVVRLGQVDALTTESVRLRNATFQQCRY